MLLPQTSGVGPFETSGNVWCPVGIGGRSGRKADMAKSTRLTQGRHQYNRSGSHDRSRSGALASNWTPEHLRGYAKPGRPLPPLLKSRAGFAGMPM